MAEETTPTPAKQASTVPNLFKKYVLYVLVGGLIISALISIVAVLAGEFGEVAGRSLATTVVIMVHALLGLMFLSASHTRSLSAAIVVNALFAIVVGSMLTAIVGIWELVSGATIADLYGTLFLGFVAALIISGLVSAHTEDKAVNAFVLSASVATVVSFTALLPWVFQNDAYVLPEIYFRIVAALFIVTATLIILTVIFDRMYVVKHPEAVVTKPGAMPLWAKFLIGLAIFIFGGWLIIPLIFGLLFGFF